MAKRVFNEEAKRLVAGLIDETKTGAGHFARGYRRGLPRGSVKVEPVGKYWGVFDYDPQPGRSYMTLEEGKELGKELGKRRYGRKKEKPAQQPFF